MASLKYNFGGIDGAASAVQGTADVFDFKAVEAGEASCSLKYNFGGIDGAASSVQGTADGFDLKAMEAGEASCSTQI